MSGHLVRVRGPGAGHRNGLAAVAADHRLVTGAGGRRWRSCRVVRDLDLDAEAAAGGAPDSRVSTGAGGRPPDNVEPEARAAALWHWSCRLRAIRGALIFNHQRPRLRPSRGPAQLHAKGCALRGVGEDI